MNTSPFSPWTDTAAAAPEPGDPASGLQQAAEQLSEAAARLAALGLSGASSAASLQITVASPLGEPLPFTLDAGPDLSLLS